MKYSVIDVSSNSVSLIAADVDGRSPQNAEIFFKQRENLSLLTYTEGNNLSARGVEKLVDAVNAAKNVSRNLGVKRAYLIATAVMRVISNADEVEEVLWEKTGMRVNFIDGETEAYCDWAANAYYSNLQNPVLVDVGGKSMEVCDLSKTDKGGMLCLDFGILDLREKFVKKIQPDEQEGEAIKKYVKGKFNDAALPKEGVYDTMVLAGPVCNAVYEVYCEYSGARDEGDERLIERKTFKKMVNYLLTDSGRSGLILKCAPEKLALIAPAAVVLRNLFKRFGVSYIVVSERGVKEGYLKLVLDGAEGLYFDFEEADKKTRAVRPAAKKTAAKPARRAPVKRAKKANSPKDMPESTEDNGALKPSETAEEIVEQITEQPAEQPVEQTAEQTEETQTEAEVAGTEEQQNEQ